MRGGRLVLGVGLRGRGIGRAGVRPGPAGWRSAAELAGLAVLDHGELGAHRDRLVLVDGDAAQDPGGGRGDLGVHLVGRHLEERLVHLDALAFLLQPARDGALGDALAELRHRYGDRHVS